MYFDFLAQIHHKAQRFQALRALFRQVAHEDEQVVRAQSNFAQQCFEQRKAAVNVAHSDDAAAGMRGDALNGDVHVRTPLCVRVLRDFSLRSKLTAAGPFLSPPTLVAPLQA